ncbi:MAG: hypothetical protein ACP5FH_09570 [Terracidiphilus sp.]
MSQSFWEPEVVADPQSEAAASRLASGEQAAEPAVLALSMDDFAALEERILRAVNGLKRERTARATAEERAAAAEARLGEQTALVENLQKEAFALRAEREQVRQRVERLLAQLDALEL